MRTYLCFIALLITIPLLASELPVDNTRLPVSDTVVVDTLLSTQAEPRKMNIMRKTIRDLDRMDNDYIEPMHYEFAVQLGATRNYENFVISSNGQSVRLAPDQPIKVGPYFGWRWIFLGWTFDLRNISFTGNGSKREFDISIYTSKVGVDLVYRRTGNDYKLRELRMGNNLDGGRLEGMPFSGVNVGITGVSTYYIFNHKRFSYPAAFSPGACQKVSCGSWMAGTGYMVNTINLDFDQLKSTIERGFGHEQEVELDSGLMFNKIKYHDFSLSGGYAYNWVFATNWLFCASAQLALAYKTSYGNTAEESKGFSFHKVNPDGIGRFALVYNNTRWYSGATFILRTNNYHTSRFKANNMFGSLNAFIGYNFKLKKRYRNRK